MNDHDAQVAAYLHADRMRDLAVALNWSHAQGNVMDLAYTAGLYLDDKGFHLRGRRGGRGRQVRRARVESLIAGGFLAVEGADVMITNDGYDAYMSWSLNVDASVEADAELADLPPLARGEEARRRRAAYDAADAERTAYVDALRAQVEAAAERAERLLAVESATARDAEIAISARGAWDAVYGPESVHTYTDADRGNVVTVFSVAPGEADLDDVDVEADLPQAVEVVDAELAELAAVLPLEPAAAVELAALDVVRAEAERAERAAAAVRRPLVGARERALTGAQGRRAGRSSRAPWASSAPAGRPLARL